MEVAIIGDIAHPGGRSACHGLIHHGSPGPLLRPGTLIPPFVECLGATRARSMEEAVAGADVVMMLRVQRERLGETLFPSDREYAQRFGLAPRHLALAKPDVIVMHPGPLNRGLEISPAVADGPCSVILDQVENGVAVRMALLYLLIGQEA